MDYKKSASPRLTKFASRWRSELDNKTNPKSCKKSAESPLRFSFTYHLLHITKHADLKAKFPFSIFQPCGEAKNTKFFSVLKTVKNWCYP
ncbi:hypothetical protein CEJ87_09055 [Caldifermentibacillus hisashii]|nr:hypothetical protein CEJ87_09055 [Caldifermentibacillus hisashii]